MKIAEIHEVKCDAIVTTNDSPKIVASDRGDYGNRQSILRTIISYHTNSYNIGKLDPNWAKNRTLIAYMDGVVTKIEIPVRFGSLLEYQRFVWERVETVANEQGLVVSGYITFKETE